MMLRRYAGAILTSAAIFFVPLAGAPERILHPGPWIGFLAAVVTLLSQPHISTREMVTDAPDRFSALGIYIGMITSQVGALLEFGYRAEFKPEAASGFTLGGLSLVLASLGFRLWAIRTLGLFFTSRVMTQEGQTVVQSGPYRLLRHPSYTGALGVSLGVALAMASPLGGVLTIVLAVPAYLYRIAVEERTLRSNLGRPYEEYRLRTWRLLPFVF